VNPARDNAGIFFPPPLLYAIPFAIGIFLHQTVGHDRFPAEVAPAARVAGIALVAAAVILALIAEIHFVRAGTSALPFRPTTAVVRGGPYRFTRNPMYVGLALLFLGLTLIIGYAWPLACLPLAVLAVDRFVIPREERYLEKKFGEPYQRYRQSVRRWI
jgi:protein-S-isoprenylcysteine O-methyltransferase Ste14